MTCVVKSKMTKKGGGKMKANMDIREWLYNARIPLWMLADAMGVHENTVVRWLRRPVTHDQRERIVQAIENILNGK